MDLKGMSRKELEKLKADVDKALVAVESREKKDALKAAEKAAADFGFTLAEIVSGSTTAKKASRPGAARYKNPENPSQTWTGKGRQPGWFKAALAAGTDPSVLEI